MTPWIFALALAEPPEGIPYDDAKVWEKHVDRALDGPPGCWLMKGNSHSTITISSAVSMWGRSDVTTITSIGKWNGKLVDGTWTELAYQLVTGESGEPNGFPARPLIGRADSEIIQVNGEPWLDEDDKERRAKRAEKREEKEASEGQKVTVSVKEGKDGDDGDSDPGSTAVNTLRRLIDGLDTSTAVSTADWRESIGAVQLDQDVPLTDENTDILVHVTSVFPNGQPDPIRISVTFPKSATFGSFPTRITLYDGQLHVVQHPVRDRVLPIAERASVVANVLGFKVGVDQRLDYTSAQPCP